MVWESDLVDRKINMGRKIIKNNNKTYDYINSSGKIAYKYFNI